MARAFSRRRFLHLSGEAVAVLGFSALAGPLTSEAHAQSLPVRSVTEDDKEDFFYREY